MTKVNLGKDTSGRNLVLDDTTIAKIRWAEAKLGWKFAIIQGSYMGAASAARSGQTHQAGGAVDLRTWDIPKSIGVTKALTALRQAGLIAWFRPQSAFPDHEIHALDYGNPNLSAAAKSQVASYLAGGNGLTGPLAGSDDGPKVTIPKLVPGSTGVPVTTTYGIDVSHRQPANILTLAAGQGYRFAVIKCTQGTGFADPAYAAHLAAAKKAGLLTAVYHFLEHGNAAAQAANLAAHIGDKSLPVFIDVEPTGASIPRAADWITFRKAATGLGLKVVGKYLTESYWQSIGRPSLVGPLALWRAAYPSSVHDYGSKLYPGNDHARWNPFGGQTPVLWQFASSGKIDGYSGSVDLDAYRGSRADLAKTGLFKDYAPVVVVPPVVVPPVVVPPVVVVPDPPVVVPPTPAVTHTVLQVNLDQKTTTAAIIARATNLIADHSPDVVVWNELGTRDKGVAVKTAIKALPGYYSTFASNVGISWKSDRFTHVGAVQVTSVNPGVAGITEQRVIISVDLTDKQTGKTYRQKGGHSVHHVDQGGKARVTGLITGQNARARKYFAVLAAELLADKAKGPVAFCGDLNVDLLAEQKRLPANRTAWFPLTTCATPPVGRVYTIGKATHNDGRLIDWTIVSGRLKGVAQEVLPLNGSDHHPVLSTVALP